MSLLAPSSYLDDCLRRKVIFFTGKGGVGKSSLAWATALACQRAGARVTFASWSPFSEVDPPEWIRKEGITWAKLDTLGCFKEYVVKHFKLEPLFHLIFDNRIFRSFVLAAPGLAETIVAGKIWDMIDAKEQDLVVIDLPASGHAVSFFHSTIGVQKIFPVGFIHDQTTKILEMWRSPACRIDLVGLPEEMPITESLELKARLQEMLGIKLGFFLINRCQPEFNLSQPAEVPEDLERIREAFLRRKGEETQQLATAARAELPLFTIPQFAEDSWQELIRQLSQYLESRGRA